jgi:hypothetical protein
MPQVTIRRPFGELDGRPIQCRIDDGYPGAGIKEKVPIAPDTPGLTERLDECKKGNLLSRLVIS